MPESTATLADRLASAAFRDTHDRAVERLLAARNASGHWTGQLSSSALSTATAINALRLADAAGTAAGQQHRFSSLIRRGCNWLTATQLPDGSWGDTTSSRGNLSTTLLAWSSLGAVAAAKPLSQPGLAAAIDRAAQRICDWTGGLSAESIAAALAAAYGRDRTFSVPILTHILLADRFGDQRTTAAWAVVPQLPFELAALPQRWFRLVDLQVVSYALPALIAIGQVRHAFRPVVGPAGWLRRAAKARTLATLQAIQPAGGGFLEATPLTSFVTMSLAAMGLAAHPVARAGCEFLAASVRPDGSWPIDTNLATWNTTTAVAALAAGDRLAEYLSAAEQTTIRDWLLDQQWRQVHPYTGAAPGGWAWTDLPGGVPDADDTSGAVLALSALAGGSGANDPTAGIAAAAGLDWLTGLANRDGGLPTFCRGWGRLPFDTSCPDITAHLLRAAAAWPATAQRHRRAIDKAHHYLATTQQADGSWLPLWFGNQAHPEQANPTYGTAKVVLATGDHRGVEWLLRAQAADGGFGPATGLPASVEETALAVEALATATMLADQELANRIRGAVARGLGWLINTTNGGTEFPAAPIGLYFARLWYFEDLYPLSFTVAACERAVTSVRQPVVAQTR